MIMAGVASAVPGFLSFPWKPVTIGTGPLRVLIVWVSDTEDVHEKGMVVRAFASLIWVLLP